MREPALRSILIATDLTAECDAAVAAAVALAERTGAALHVIHALDFRDAPYAAVPARTATFPERVDAVEAAVEEQLARAAPAGVTVASRELILYAAWKAIAERARFVEADLIVLGGHCPRAVGDRLLGTTAERVLRRAPVPCLLLHAPLPLPLHRVLAAVDLSTTGASALDAAFAWAGDLGPRLATATVAPDSSAAAPAGGPPAPAAVELTVLHVVPPAVRLPGGLIPEDVAAAELARVVERSRVRAGEGAAAADVREVVSGGDPATEILARADALDADLLVLGTHGQGALERAIIGSVAQAVARGATRAVLLVPPTVAPGPSAKT